MDREEKGLTGATRAKQQASPGLCSVPSSHSPFVQSAILVLPDVPYQDLEDLLASLQAKVIAPTEQKAQELARQR